MRFMRWVVARLIQSGQHGRSLEAGFGRLVYCLLPLRKPAVCTFASALNPELLLLTMLFGTNRVC